MSPSTQGRTCAFCAMLALRGFAYTNQEAAGGEGNAFHHDCDCRIIPTWGEQTLPNYDWRKYERWYEETKELLEAGALSIATPSGRCAVYIPVNSGMAWFRSLMSHGIMSASAHQKTS